MWIDILAGLASIITGLVALAAALHFRREQTRQQRKLESYLREVKVGAGEGEAQRTLLHLMAKLGMSEAEVLHASYRSEFIKCPAAANVNTRRVPDLLLEYVDLAPVEQA